MVRLLLVFFSLVGATTLSSACPIGCEDCFCDDQGTVQCTNYSSSELPPCLTPDVTSLYIYGSNIVSLKEGDLANATSLETFVLTDSPLYEIEQKAFDNAGELTFLTLSGNQLTQFPDNVFLNVSKLKELIVQRNEIFRLTSETFAGLEALEVLDMEGNGVSSQLLEGVLSHLTSLTVLNLAGNYLTLLNEKVLSGLTNLRELYLSGNRINNVSHIALQVCTELETLELQDNEIGSLGHNTFSTNKKLKALDLAGNAFTNVPEAVKVASSIEILKLDRNPIGELLENSFNGVNSLKVLHLNEMTALSTIRDGAFKALSELTHLSVTDNHGVTSFSASVMPWEEVTSLKSILLRNNSITRFEEALLIHLDSLIEAEIHDNPIQCDCDALWIHQVMEVDDFQWAQQWKNIQELAPVCGSPYHFSGLRIEDISANDLTCSLAEVAYQWTEEKNGVAVIGALLNRGMPTTEWTTPDGTSVHPARPINTTPVQITDDEISRYKAEESLLSNGSIQAKLVIEFLESTDEGTYVLHATSAGGVLNVTIPYSLPSGGLSSGARAAIVVASFLLAAAVLACLLKYYRKKRSNSWQNLEEEADEQREGLGVTEEQTEKTLSDTRAPAEATALTGEGQGDKYGSTAAGNQFGDPRGSRVVNRPLADAV